MEKSLFETSGGTPMTESARWIEGVLFGESVIALCVIAVAFIGALMLTGRLPLRESARIVIGCFVLLGAPVIAAGLVGEGEDPNGSTSAPLPAPEAGAPRRPLPPADFDPYAGASLGAN